MSYLTEKKFSFVSSALESDTFAVVEFKGSEALSKPYEFEIMLVTEQSDIDLNSVLQQPASFTFHRETGGDVIWNGIVAQFEQLHNYNIYTFYRAVLVPKLWWLQLTHHNQIFLDKTVQEIIEVVLKDGGLTTLDFEFKLQNNYSKIDYVCQYEESHYDFVSRWMEREGLYYYFEQTENGEKVIITDTKMAHTGMPLGDTLYYSPPSGLDTLHRTEVIQSFNCRQKLVPNKIFLKDYNYETPSLAVTGSANVDPGGRGEVYYYGENFRNSTEGNWLAKIRSEEILCRKEQYIGESTVPFVMPGYSLKLEDHYRPDFNKEYLIISVDFSGSQTGYLIAGIKQALSEREERVYYSNTFTAIPYDIQFRTERRTKKSKIYGTLPAKIDAAGSGEYAELDSQGRYKVIMPFDESRRQSGSASIWLRMVQPYAGSGHGMHFPLHKGTEVMIAFTDGDPDRPIIVGAVPNPETSNMVNVNNQTQSVIQTASNNRIAIEDNAGNERILLHTPKQASFIRIGKHNDPPPRGGEVMPEPGRGGDIQEIPPNDPDPTEGGGETTEPATPPAGGATAAASDPEEITGVKIYSDDGVYVGAGFKNEVILGEKGDFIGGIAVQVVANPLFTLGTVLSSTYGLIAYVTGLFTGKNKVNMPRTLEEWKEAGWKNTKSTFKFLYHLLGANKIEVSLGNEFVYHKGKKIEKGAGFKRDATEPIEHISDKKIVNLCDGGQAGLSHHLTIDPDGVSSHGKVVHIRSSDTGKEGADIRREISMTQADGIKIESTEGAREFGRITFRVDQLVLQVRKGQAETSWIEIGSKTIEISGKPDVKINSYTFGKDELKAGPLQITPAGKVQIG